MAVTRGPSVGRLRLRVALRQARDVAGLTQEQVAAEMEWSLSKVIRIESGSVSISLTDLKALLDLYRIVDEQQVRELTDLARTARRRSGGGDWTEYRERYGPGFASYVGLEAETNLIRHFHPVLIPALFQTGEFARLVLRRTRFGPEGDDEREALVELLARRQQDLLGRDDPPMINVILDESVVRRPVGDRALMHHQLSHLVEIAESDRVDVQVIEFRAGLYPAMVTPFVLLEFPDEASSPVLFLENGLSGTIVDRTEEVDQYRQIFDHLCSIALPEPESMTLLKSITKEFS